MKLRYYQQEAIDSIINYLCTKDGNPVASLATGTGKSIIIAELSRIFREKWGARVCICTHVSDLVAQNHAEYVELTGDLTAGIYSSGLKLKQAAAPTLFCGIQSVFRNPYKIGKVDALIIDECHTISRKAESMWHKFINGLREMQPNLRIIGLSATPFRLDSGSLVSGEGALFDDLVYEYGILDGIKDGFLSPLVPKSMATKYDRNSVGKRGGEFIESQAQKVVDVDELSESAVKEIIEYGVSRRTWMIFCQGVDHCYHIAEKINAAGFSCAVVTGDTPADEREAIYSDLKNFKLRAVCSVAVMTTGTNIPPIDLIALLRMTESGGLLVQMAGRGTRLCDGKKDCLVLDFMENIRRHGPIDMIRGKDKEKGDGVPPMKECPNCDTILHASIMQCPECGYEFPKPVATEPTIADDIAITSDQIVEEIEEHKITRVEYSRHVGKQGKPDTLRVRYFSGFTEICSEWVCLDHPLGSWARNNAESWWLKRDTNNTLGRCPFGIDMAASYGNTGMLLVPKTLKIKKDGKYWRIIRYGQLVSLKELQQLHLPTEQQEHDTQILFG